MRNNRISAPQQPESTTTENTSSTGRGVSRRVVLNGIAGIGGVLAAGSLVGGCSSGLNSTSSGGATGAATGGGGGGGTVELNYLYPVAVAGPLAQMMTSLVNDFNAAHPSIKVKSSFTGDYGTNLTKIVTSVKGGNSPDVSILSIGDQQSLLDLKALQPLDQLAQQANVQVAFDDFYPAFINETKSGGATYGLPFQRSTPVLYYNASVLDDVGVGQAPATWDELVATGQKMMAAKKVQWGVQFPTAIWQFQGLVLEAGRDITGSDLAHVDFNSPAAVTALNWLVELGTKHQVSPPGVVDLNSAPAAFSGGQVGYLYNSSGALASVLQQAKFKVGTAFMPKKEKFGAPTGGGNLYVFKNIPADRQQAAMVFVDWMTQPTQAARWSVNTGYVPSRKAVVDTQAWKDYVGKYPQATVAIDQLQYAVPSLSSHATSEVSNILLQAMQSALTGQASAADSLNAAQTKADAVLAQYR